MRLLNRLLAFIVAAALACLGVAVIVEVIAFHLGTHPALVQWPAVYRWGNRNTFSAGSVKLACALTAAVGLILLAVQLKPRRPSRVPVQAASPATDAALTRRGVASAVQAAVTEVDGIRSGTVRVRRRRVRVTATSAAAEARTAQQMRGALAEAVDTRLDALQLKHRPRTKIRLSTRRR